jgi:3-oxoacyl-[acyl-carrier-protein] synthase II
MHAHRCNFPYHTGVVVRASAAVRDPSKRVVITGIGCCTVFGNDPDKFYEK